MGSASGSASGSTGGSGSGAARGSGAAGGGSGSRAAGSGAAQGGSASTARGSALEPVEWTAETGEEAFAPPTNHEDCVRHLSEVLLRGCPDQGTGKHGKSPSQMFCENFEAFGLPAMKRENEDKKIWEEYAAQAGYMCQTCMDRRNLVVRPPFESMAVLRYTDRVQHVPDNKGDALRVVFSASQRDCLIAIRMVGPWSPFVPWNKKKQSALVLTFQSSALFFCLGSTFGVGWSKSK